METSCCPKCFTKFYVVVLCVSLGATFPKGRDRSGLFFCPQMDTDLFSQMDTDLFSQMDTDLFPQMDTDLFSQMHTDISASVLEVLSVSICE